MKNKRNIIILSILLGLLIIGGIVFITINSKNNFVSKEEINNEIIDQGGEQGTLEFFNAIAGVKAENIEIINSPVIGIKGNIFAPETAIINGINYFLKNTNNDKMKNLNLDIENNSINIYVTYAVIENFNTPIKVSISPSINENKDLVINIEEVKILDLKLADFLVNLALKTFVKDWFVNSNIGVEYEKSKVIISNKNFIGIGLDSIIVNNGGISLDMTIEAEKFIK